MHNWYIWYRYNILEENLREIPNLCNYVKLHREKYYNKNEPHKKTDKIIIFFSVSY